MTINNNADEIKPHYIIKICILGQGGVGKTCICRRLCYNTFDTETQLTIGVDFYTYDLPILINGEKKFIRLSLWDFGGQERFRPLLEDYSKGAKGALLLFDLTRPASLNGIEEWVDICRIKNPDIPIIFLGTKLDLIDAITIEDRYAAYFMYRYNFFKYLKISSKTGYNVNLAFELLTKEMLRKL